MWAGLSATGFVGPGTSILSALSAAIDDPVQYVWQQFQSLRRENTLSIAGVLTGPRVISMSSVELGTKESSSPEAVAAFGADAVVFQRLILKVAADTYGDPVTLTVEILGTETHSADVRRRPCCPRTRSRRRSISGRSLQLSFDPFNAPFAIAMTDFGAVKQIAGSPPKLTLSAKTPQAFQARLGRRDPSQPAAAGVRGRRRRPDSWGATFGVTTFELTIPKSAAGDLLGIFLPSAGVVLRGKLLFRVDADGFHFDGGVGLSATWPDTVRLPGVVIHSLVDERGGLRLRLPDHRHGHHRGFSRAR